MPKLTMKEVDTYFDEFWEEEGLSEEYIVDAVRRSRSGAKTGCCLSRELQ